MSLEFPQILNLDKLNVYREEDVNSPQFFIIKNLPNVLTYGKHYFNISYQDPENSNLRLKQSSQVLFEFKDKNGNVIFSDLTDTYDDVSGAAVGYVWIRKDPLRIADEINDGVGYMTIVGELEGVPQQFQGIYNVRLTIPFEIRKDFVNRSPILFQSLTNLQNKSSFTETVEADSDSSLNKIERSYFNISASHMDTYGGQVSFIEILYKESRAKATEFTVLTTYQLTGSKANFTSSDLSISSSLDGLNPSSHLYKFPTPTDIRRNGSVEFKLRFMNPDMQVAKNISNGKDVEISGSITNFTGSKILVDTSDGIFVTGSGGLIFGKDKTTGFRLDFKPEGTGVHKAEDSLEFTRISASVDKKPLVFSQKGSVLSDMESNSITGSEKSVIIGSSTASISHSFNSAVIGASNSQLIRAPFSSIFGGTTQKIETGNTTLALQNENFGSNFIFGGKNHTISSSKVLFANTIVGGNNNQIGQSTAAGLVTISANAIAGGNNNVISGGLFNFIGGGQSNEIGDESGGTTGCQYGVILGGTKNYINVVVSSAQDGPAIIGGRSNIVNHDGAVIIGMNGKTSTATNTVYVQNLDVAGNILGPITIDGNLTVNGEATYISSSTIVTSGSNIFGDDSSDTHIFNGKITASGNVDGGDYVIKIHNSNNDAGTDKGAGIEFAHNFVGSATVKPAGKIIAGKDNNYAGADSNVDSNLQFFTALNGTNTERLKIDSNGLVHASGDISGSTIEGQTLTADVFLSAPSASITNLTNTNITSSGNISASGDLFVDDITCDDITLTNLFATADSDVFVDINNSGFAFEANSGDQITFNLNNQNNVDFVVSGEADSQTLYVDASTDRVGIGTATPTKKLQVTGDISASSFLASTFLSSPSASITNLTNTNITASGNISASGTITMLTASIGGGIFTSASLAAGGGGGGGSMNNFTLTADGGSNQTIADGNTLDIAGGTNITTAVGATDTVTVNLDASPSVTNITASGNISASGKIITSELSALGDLTIDADGADILLKDGGTEFGRFKRDSSDFVLKSATNNKDIVFRGVDDSSTITALTLDMSEAGKAIFTGDISGSSTSTLSVGGQATLGGINSTTHITASGNISSSGTIIAEHFFSSDDAQINDDLTVDGDINANGNIVGDDSTNITNIARVELDTLRADATQHVNILLGTSGIKFDAEDGDTFNFNGELFSNTDLNYYDANEDIIFNIDQSVPAVTIGALGGVADTTLFVNGTSKFQGGSQFMSHITSSGNISSSGDLITSGFHVSSSGNVMINSDNTGSMATHLGAFSVNYGTHTQLTGSLAAVSDGYGDIVKIGGTTGLTAGSMYYLKTNGLWGITNGTDDSEGAKELLAIALGTNSDVDGMLLRGFIKVNPAGTQAPGAPVYMRASNGAVSYTINSTSGNIVRIVGYGLTTDGHIYFNPDSTFVEVA